LKKKLSKKFINFKKEQCASKYNRSLTKEKIVNKKFGELRDFKYNLEGFNYKGGIGMC
jgi:hypothetical protein